MSKVDTKTQILDAALDLIQTHGFNAFSFRHVSERVGISTASIHHHFATKLELCRALLARHRELIGTVLAGLDAEGLEPVARLERFAVVFQNTLESGNRMCPFGMLAAESRSLDAPACAELLGALDDMAAWLAGVLEEGRERETLAFEGRPEEEARLLLSTLEGAMLIARTYGEPARFASAVDRSLEKLKRRDTGPKRRR
jgi:TetR/AcrR family transcriptional repressor of nem operon